MKPFYLYAALTQQTSTLKDQGWQRALQYELLHMPIGSIASTTVLCVQNTASGVVLYF